MYRSINSPAFERDVKKCMKKHWDMGSFKAAISAILHSDEEPIPLKYNDHAIDYLVHDQPVTGSSFDVKLSFSLEVAA